MFAEPFLSTIVIYASSILTLLSVPMLTFIGHIPRWIMGLYMCAFIACALGLECLLIH